MFSSSQCLFWALVTNTIVYFSFTHLGLAKPYTHTQTNRQIHAHKWKKRKKERKKLKWNQQQKIIMKAQYFHFLTRNLLFFLFFLCVAQNDPPNTYTLSRSEHTHSLSQNSVTKIYVLLLHALTNQREWEMKAERH